MKRKYSIGQWLAVAAAGFILMHSFHESTRASGTNDSHTEPPMSEPDTESQQTGVIRFSGYNWYARNSNGYSGPGLNIFSAERENVWLDEQGQLHLRITRSKGKWQCAEIFTEMSVGYGEYIFTLASPAEKIDRNVVLGLFTWDDNSFESDANSEIDIEFARWGQERMKPLQFSVQPTDWSSYTERYFTAADYNPSGEYTTHYFRWTPESVKFRSYQGLQTDDDRLAASWDFDAVSPPRRKTEGGRSSAPVVIPKPRETTRVHINLWLHDANRDGFGDAPSDGRTAEIVIRSFEFRPLPPPVSGLGN